MGLDFVPQALCLLCALMGGEAAFSHPYGPHTPYRFSNSPFFQGWWVAGLRANQYLNLSLRQHTNSHALFFCTQVHARDWIRPLVAGGDSGGVRAQIRQTNWCYRSAQVYDHSSVLESASLVSCHTHLYLSRFAHWDILQVLILVLESRGTNHSPRCATPPSLTCLYV
jgi:hypothetical protein